MTFVEGSSFPEDIEVVQQRLSIAHDLEDPAIASRGGGGEVKLYKMEEEGVGTPRIYRNRVAEMPISFSGKEVRVRRIKKPMCLIGKSPVHEIVIRMPKLSLAVSQWHGLHDQTDWKLGAVQGRQDFYSIQSGWPHRARKGNPKEAVTVRRDITKETLIGDVFTHGVHVDVESQ